METDGSKQHANACSRSSLFLAKVLIAMDPKQLGAVCDLYAALQKKYALDPKSKVHSSIFTEWTSWLAAKKQQA